MQKQTRRSSQKETVKHSKRSAKREIAPLLEPLDTSSHAGNIKNAHVQQKLSAAEGESGEERMSEKPVTCIGKVCGDEVLDSMDNLEVNREDLGKKGMNIGTFFGAKRVAGGEMLAGPR